jgi:pimeloyl-ACP methyl ester carboxylesterase
MKRHSEQREVDTLLEFDFGGPPQWALVRGRSRSSPVLLLVQAGPGLPMIQEAFDIERRLRLEEHFRVVYWDQRGTGRSFDAKDRAPIALDTAIGDVGAMILALCARLAVTEVDVVGFSFGASLALLACAADGKLPVRSLTGVGADVSLLEGERFALAFALGEAARRGNERALRALRAIGEPPHDGKRFTTRVRWVANFGGVQRGKGFGALLRTTVARLWRSPHYGLGQMLGALRGLQATPDRLLPALREFDLRTTPLAVRAPVALFHGRQDKAAPPALTAELGKRLGVDVTWFEESAHLPHEEEPARFRAELLRFLSREEAPARTLSI